MAGHEFAGYTIIRELPPGGMTRLCVAIDRRQQRVVLRRLKNSYLHDRRARHQFLRGAEILARLHHPNLVRLIKAGMFCDEPYIALEYIDARNMSALIRSKSPLLYRNVLTMLRQMASALHYVHLAGYWHLDIKPENFIVRPDGLVVLLDFDLAIERSLKPVKLSPMPGTFAYLPPESITKNIVHDQTDIFAFGVSCYEILAGHKPFEGLTPEDSRRMQADLATPPARINSSGKTVNPRLESLVFKCLAKQPGDRYPLMSLVVRDIESII
jgi:eukaryotic-like serine/threonine-protein kinase